MDPRPPMAMHRLSLSRIATTWLRMRRIMDRHGIVTASRRAHGAESLSVRRRRLSYFGNARDGAPTQLWAKTYRQRHDRSRGRAVGQRLYEVRWDSNG